jgi:hypothetical protein
MSKGDHLRNLDMYGREGVNALKSATPIDSAETAASWNYKIERSGRSVSIAWTNTNVVDGTPLIILLQYGHGTGTGGYVQGRDIINPAMRPIFNKIADNVWKAVTSA